MSLPVTDQGVSAQSFTMARSKAHKRKLVLAATAFLGLAAVALLAVQGGSGEKAEEADQPAADELLGYDDWVRRSGLDGLMKERTDAGTDGMARYRGRHSHSHSHSHSTSSSSSSSSRSTSSSRASNGNVAKSGSSKKPKQQQKGGWSSMKVFNQINILEHGNRKLERMVHRLSDKVRNTKSKRRTNVHIRWYPKGTRGPPGPMGPIGDPGPRGVVGPRGRKGGFGVRGPRGRRGRRGPRGIVGQVGAPGQTGKMGKQGTRGPAGKQGPVGPRGHGGIPGKNGHNGKNGRPGQNGAPGAQGVRGSRGRRGPPGRITVVRRSGNRTNNGNGGRNRRRSLVTLNVISATTSRPARGARVRFTCSGQAPVTTTANAQGVARARLYAGSWTATVLSNGGFQTQSFRVTVNGTGSVTRRVVASPRLSTNQARFVLTWRARPRDMDSWMHTPGGCLLKYNRRLCNAGGQDVRLDVDDVNGHGPETISINRPRSGVYTYKVHQYSSDGNLATSGAVATIYAGGRQYRFLAGRHGRIRGRVWCVAQYNPSTRRVTPCS